jgi:hypothetical protein
MLVFLKIEKLGDVNNLRLSTLIFLTLVPHPKNVTLTQNMTVTNLQTYLYDIVIDKHYNIIKKLFIICYSYSNLLRKYCLFNYCTKPFTTTFSLVLKY